MAMGADYLFELISIETYAPNLSDVYISFLGSVEDDWSFAAHFGCKKDTFHARKR